MQIETMRAELDALTALERQHKKLTFTPIVDDDYPEVRRDYELAVMDLISAFKANGRIVEVPTSPFPTKGDIHFLPESKTFGYGLVKFGTDGVRVYHTLASNPSSVSVCEDEFFIRYDISYYEEVLKEIDKHFGTSFLPKFRKRKEEFSDGRLVHNTQG